MNGFTLFKKLAGIIPEPKYIQVDDGVSKLSRDVRLTTINVQPLQRKTMRNIFNAAGIKVVANKKIYLINATVNPNLELPENVPETAKEEYFEISIKGTNIFLTAISQSGVIWGSSTLAGVFQNYDPEEPLPNMTIRDWPSISCRGLFLHSTWALALMELNDWTMMGDMMAISRYNQIFFELSGAPTMELFSPEGNPIFLGVFPEGHKLQQMKMDFPRTWYSSKFDLWKHKKQYPLATEKQNLQDLLLILREREMQVTPTFSLYNGNRAIPTKAPKLAARRPRGGVKKVGLCYTNELTWKFLSLYFEGLFSTYFDNSPEKVCLRLDEGFVTHDGVSSFCECKQCTARSGNYHIEDLVKVIALIKEKGAKHVVLADSVEAREIGLIGKDLIAALKKAKLLDFVSLIGRESTLEDSLNLPCAQIISINNEDEFFFRNKTKELRDIVSKLPSNATPFFELSYTPLQHEHLLAVGEKLWNQENFIDENTTIRNWVDFSTKQEDSYVFDILDCITEAINMLPPEFYRAKSFEESVTLVKSSAAIKESCIKAEELLKKTMTQILDITDILNLPTGQRTVYYCCRSQASTLLGYLQPLNVMTSTEDKNVAADLLCENLEISERGVPEWMSLVAYQGLCKVLMTLRPPLEDLESLQEANIEGSDI